MACHLRFPLVILLLVGMGLPLWADGELRPRFEVGTSFVFGNATELVFRPSENRNYNDPISRLVWPIPPSLSVDLSLEWPWSAQTSTVVALRGLFPLTVGTMVDEDWRTATRDPTVFLNYARSEHQGYLTGHWQARIEQTFSANDFSFALGGEYRQTNWEGWNGTGRYDETTTSGSVSTRGTEEITFSGLLIAYKQQWYLPYVGTSWRWRAEGWTITPTVRFSPFVWCFDMDNHNYATDATMTFLDSVRGGVYGYLALEMAFGDRGAETWGIRGTWEGTYGAIGETTETQAMQSATTFSTYSNAAGAWFQETSFAVFVRN